MNQLALAIKHERQSQWQDLLDYLNSHGSITCFEAAFELGIMQLSARVIDLEKRGYVVPREWHHGQARNGRKWAVMRYLRPVKSES